MDSVGYNGSDIVYTFLSERSGIRRHLGLWGRHHLQRELAVRAHPKAMKSFQDMLRTARQQNTAEDKATHKTCPKQSFSKKNYLPLVGFKPMAFSFQATLYQLSYRDSHANTHTHNTPVITCPVRRLNNFINLTWQKKRAVDWYNRPGAAMQQDRGYVPPPNIFYCEGIVACRHPLSSGTNTFVPLDSLKEEEKEDGEDNCSVYDCSGLRISPTLRVLSYRETPIGHVLCL